MVRCFMAIVVAIILTITLLTPLAVGEPWPLCGTTSNFTSNSPFQANLKIIAAMLPRKASMSRGLYATHAVGTVPDKVWAMVLCCGDVKANACFTCLAQAIHDVQSDCAYNKDTSIYYDRCMLHYSNVHTLPSDDSGPMSDIYGVNNIANISSNQGRFNRILVALLNATADFAAFNSTRRFATAEANFVNKDFPTLYSLVQCPPDQQPVQCRSCLTRTITNGLPYFLNKIGGRVYAVNCTYRYETSPFYNGSAMVRLASESTGAPFHKTKTLMRGRQPARNHKKVFITALVASIAVFCAMLVGCILLLSRPQKGAGTERLRWVNTRKSSNKTQDALKLWRIEENGSAFTLHDFSVLAEATSGFSIQNQLGRGGFGPVYKGKLGDGTEIAVKRLAAHSVQGLVEFKNEIQLIAKLQHENLVHLVGCCVEDEEKMLVCEYMSNGSLDFFIFDPLRGQLLDWKKRLHIIEGIVQGLLYMHKLSRVRIIHRDLKASNILLDKDLNPKISDFGMARIFSSNNTEVNTNRIVGTYGYVAPEYASEGIFSVRSDVFSFGVLLLEIISSKRNCGYEQYRDFVNLLGYAWHLWREGKAAKLIDPVLGDCCDTVCITRCIKVALLYVQENAMDRPTMTEVAVMLGSDGAALKDPRQPPHFQLRFNDDNSGREDVLDSEKDPLFTLVFSTHNNTMTGDQDGTALRRTQHQ